MRLEDLISQDFELYGNENWLRAKEHNSLVVDIKRQLFFWNSQGVSGDSFVWLTRVKGLSQESAKEFLRVNDSRTPYSFIHNILDKEEVVVYPKLVDVFYQNGINAPRDYWYKRGITDRTISRFKLGYDNGWYMIPFYQEGLFRDFQMRRDEPEKKVRHYYKNVGKVLFNSEILNILDTVIITEGPTDCLRLLQEGIPAVSHNAGAEHWDDSWHRFFMHQKAISVVYDNDLAGRDGAMKVARNLGVYRTKIFTFDGFDDKMDIVEFFRQGGTSDELKRLITEESKYAFELPERKKKWLRYLD